MKAEYIDHMGSDLTVVNAARVSFDKESDWEFNGVSKLRDGSPILLVGKTKKRLAERDEKLIRYLAKHDHWTPFAHPQITMRETVPFFIARQRFKHTVGFVYNEVSRRYVDDTPEFFVPETWRRRADNAKQGSSDEAVKLLDWQIGFKQKTNGPIYSVDHDYQRFIKDALYLYETMIKNGVAPEQARMVLPQSMYTSYYVTGSLSAWARAYNLRSDPHAQKEIQLLAAQWKDILQPLFPVSWEALTT